MLQRSVSELAAKKTKIDRATFDFKSKGNEDQFLFNEKVEDMLSGSTSHLYKLCSATTDNIPSPPEDVSQPIARIKKNIKEGLSVVAHRQKLTK